MKHDSVPFLGSEKVHDLQPIAKIKKLSAENRKANRKHEHQQFSVSYWSGQPRQNITSGLPYTAHNPQLLIARQHSRTDAPVNSQQANHNNSPDVLGPLFTGVRAKAKIIVDDFSVMPSRMRLEVHSQHNFKFDPGASTLVAPPPPREAQLPPAAKCYRACLLLWCCLLYTSDAADE